MFRIRRRDRDEPDFGDLEARLAELREAMMEEALAQCDPVRQRAFLADLFADGGTRGESFVAIVEARDQQV